MGSATVQAIANDSVSELGFHIPSLDPSNLPGSRSCWCTCSAGWAETVWWTSSGCNWAVEGTSGLRCCLCYFRTSSAYNKCPKDPKSIQKCTPQKAEHIWRPYPQALQMCPNNFEHCVLFFSLLDIPNQLWGVCSGIGQAIANDSVSELGFHIPSLNPSNLPGSRSCWCTCSAGWAETVWWTSSGCNWAVEGTSGLRCCLCFSPTSSAYNKCPKVQYPKVHTTKSRAYLETLPPSPPNVSKQFRTLCLVFLSSGHPKPIVRGLFRDWPSYSKWLRKRAWFSHPITKSQ